MLVIILWLLLWILAGIGMAAVVRDMRIIHGFSFTRSTRFLLWLAWPLTLPVLQAIAYSRPEYIRDLIKETEGVKDDA